MPRYLLDTNILSDLVRNPSGRIADRIAEIGDRQICTSVIVAAELRYGAAKKGSRQLTRQVAIVLGSLDILGLEAPADVTYGELRARLEQAGNLIGPYALLIAAHALSLGLTPVSDNEREFSRVHGLSIENWLR